MTAALNGRRSARFAGVALLAFTVLAPGCGRPPDEAWLRFLGFGDTSTSTSTSVAGELRDGAALTADAHFQNNSLVVGQKVGTGVLVHRVRIDYRMSGYSPPASDYSVNLYLSPPADSTPTTGSLTISLVPISLKQWLIDTGAFEDEGSDPVVDLTAHLTFYGETDEGGQLVVEGNIAIALTNRGAADAVCLCTSDLYDCEDFATEADAQECFDYCVDQGSGDIHGLDDDNDDLACEDLP